MHFLYQYCWSIIFFSLSFSPLYAQPTQKAKETFTSSVLVGQSSFEYTKKVKEELEKINDLAPENFLKDIDKYREDMEKYISHKKRVCDGEFSTVVLNEDERLSPPSSEGVINKLKPQEKKLCFRELKALQMTFINNLFNARRRYLDNLHTRRIEDLDKARDRILTSLNQSFNKSTGR